MPEEPPKPGRSPIQRAVAATSAIPQSVFKPDPEKEAEEERKRIAKVQRALNKLDTPDGAPVLSYTVEQLLGLDAGLRLRVSKSWIRAGQVSTCAKCRPRWKP